MASNSRADSRFSRRSQTRNTNERNQSRASRVSGISRTPSAERALLQRLSGTPEANDNYDGATGNGTQISDNINQTRHSQSETANRKTRQESRGQSTPQSVTGNRSETRGTVDDGEPETSETYETTASSSGQPYTSALTGRRSNRTSNEEPSQSGVIRIPHTPGNAEETDWRAGKTVPETNSYMLKYELSCDTVCIVDDTREEFKCHRYMLMSRSSVLYPLLQTNRTNIRIELPDINKDIFKDVIQYIYSDMFDVHTENVAGLLFAARRLQLRGLADICFRFLDGELNDQTVPRVIELAHEYNENILYEKCLRYIYNRGMYVLKEKSFESLCSTCLEKIIKSDELQADEEAVYEGVMKWANAECRRKKLEPSDKYRRKMLGDMLYLIRFPILNRVYFTQKISNSDLLTQGEKLNIFQHFHGSDSQNPSQFNAEERKGSANRNHNYITDLGARGNDLKHRVKSDELQFVRRFNTSEGTWRQNGPSDAITFLTSSPITLRGVQVYGTARGSEGYRINIVVVDELRRVEVRKSEVSIFTESDLRTYDIELSPVRIPARQPFTVVLTMKGSPTHKGIGGESKREVNGVMFEFKSSNKSPNGTDITVGQIPGLLFSKSE